jgi:hypothetical protein
MYIEVLCYNLYEIILETYFIVVCINTNGDKYVYEQL